MNGDPESVIKTVAIVDDDEPVRDSVDVLVRACGYGTRTFENASTFLEASLGEIACILLDVRLPDGDGIDILQKLIDRGIKIPIVIMTGHGDVPMAVKAMRIGALDFIEKPFEPDELLAAVERAVQQFAQAVEAQHRDADARERLQRLTARETEVMQQLVLGRPNKVIAYELGLSPRTVEVHRARVMEKTDAGSLSELVRLAIAAGIDPAQST
ncbi:MAG: response regulator transcription factor [Hyphomicrobiaceae bacterium]